MGLMMPIPAAFITISMTGVCVNTCSTTWFTDASLQISITSALSAAMPASLATCCSLDASLPVINTVAPLLLISLATPEPIPPVAPVTNTRLPFKVSI